MIRNTISLAILLFLGVTCMFAQSIETPQPSPLSTLEQRVGLTDISIIYSRPSIRGRVIFGDLVPYNKIWRTGANANTKIKFSDDVTLEGKKVPAGEYSLFTIPGKEEWTIILNRNTSLWGTGGGDNAYNEAEDLVRFKVKPKTMPMSVETFSIHIGDIKNTSAIIGLMWEKMYVPISLGVEFDARVMASIEKAMASAPDAGVYFQAARYYFENDKDIDKALDWVNKSLEKEEKFWVFHMKAKILKQCKEYKKAKEAAERSKKMAQEAGNDDYVRLNEELIASMGK